MLPRQSRKAAIKQQIGLTSNPYRITPGFVAAPKRSFYFPIRGEPMP
jgi:hypothetical protein